MKILSIYPYTHISSAALMINGKIVSASAEERFNRIKMSTDFPIRAINWILKTNKIRWEEIDHIVVPWNPSHNINYASSRWIKEMRWRGEMLTNIPIHIMKAINSKPAEKMEICFNKTKISFLNHHECHAASAFFTSPFKNSDILTIDGHGEVETCFLGYGKDKKIIKKFSINYPHSIGLFYGTFTDFLGFRADVDEWKVMALSSYAKKKNQYDEKVANLIQLNKKGFELDLSYFDYYSFDRRPNLFSKKFTNLFGPKRDKNENLKKRHFEIAGAMQRQFEKIVFHLLKITKKLGGKSGNIVLAGGAAMNCVFNGLLNKSKIYNNNYVPCYPDDLGVSIGGTYLLNETLSKKKRKIHQVRTAYYGPKFSEKEIFETLKKYKLIFKKAKNLNKEIANQISNGKLIGWFQDKMEFGHRALGNRSILADPRNKKMKDIINKAVKYRESFRPFAPAVLEEHSHKIFEIKKGLNVDFMEKAVKVKNNWHRRIPAVTHVDGTARIQTVSKKTNTKFYNLINEFYKITSIPLLVNTSFNLNGEPIVCNPEDAIRTFYSCGLDILVVGDYIVYK